LKLYKIRFQKSITNKQKHGIDFEEAQALWEDPERLEIPAKKMNEQRYLVIGIIGNNHWSAITTYRGQCIRLISVRRARKEEEALYENF
jgi:uncharacterized DUF497 family protein